MSIVSMFSWVRIYIVIYASVTGLEYCAKLKHG